MTTAKQALIVATLLTIAYVPASAQSPSAAPSRVADPVTCQTGPAGGGPSPARSLPSRQPDTAETAVPAPGPVASEPGEWPTLGGKGHRIADAPEAARRPVGVWTGTDVIVTDLDTGRTLSYEPHRQRWDHLATSPAGLDQARAFWTGDRMILVGDLPDDGGVTAWAYDPPSDAWTILTDAPFAGHLADAAWQSGILVIRIAPVQPGQLDSGIAFRLFDAAQGCWRAAARPEPIDADLLGVAGSILAVGPLSVSTLDASTGIWSDAAARPVRDDEPGIVVNDKVVFLTGGSGGESYDPVKGIWTTFATTCPILSGGAIPGGTLVIDDLFAFDTATDTCYRLPEMPDRHRRFAFHQWMDDRLLLWSDSKGEESPPGPSGITYKPVVDTLP